MGRVQVEMQFQLHSVAYNLTFHRARKRKIKMYNTKARNNGGDLGFRGMADWVQLLALCCRGATFKWLAQPLWALCLLL